MAQMHTVYIETSALLCLLFKEEKEKELSRKLSSASRIFTSRLTRIEAERALLRLSLTQPKLAGQVAELARELRQLWPQVDFLEMTKEVCETAGRIAPQANLRSLDAIHLASFYRLREIDPQIQMISLDERINSEV